VDADIFNIPMPGRTNVRLWKTSWRTPTRRRQLRQARPVTRREYRERRPTDAPLPDVELWSGRTIKGSLRCQVIGLPRGDCEQERWRDSAYCFYHDKLQRGLTEPTAESYPVWPLPLSGYVFTDEPIEAVVA